jgi:hypothetical protein
MGWFVKDGKSRCSSALRNDAIGTFRLIATSASTAALEGEADMAGNGPKTTFMTHLDQCLESRQHNLL